MTPQVGIAGWIGAGNVGDELLLRVTAQELRRVDLEPVALSRDPARTEREHGMEAIPHVLWPGNGRALSGLVFGGGGLVQDRSSPWSPLFQLHRPWEASRRRLPTVAIGLGAEPLRWPTSRSATRAGLRRCLEVVTRDEPSARTIEPLVRRQPVPAADLAFLLPRPSCVPKDVIVVSLVGPGSAAGIVPASFRAPARPDPALVDRWAAELDQLAGALNCRLELLSMHPERDAPWHQAIAGAIGERARAIDAQVDTVIDVIGSARLVIAERFHAGVLALHLDVPVVGVAYARKVADLLVPIAGPGVLFDGLQGDGDLEPVATRQLDAQQHLRVAGAVASLREAAARNRRPLELLSRAISERGR